jgi:hypothetical protein
MCIMCNNKRIIFCCIIVLVTTGVEPAVSVQLSAGMFLLSMRFLASGFCGTGNSFVKQLQTRQWETFGVQLAVRGMGVDFMGLPGKGVRDVNQSRSNLPCGPYSGIALSVGGYNLCCASLNQWI